MRWRLPGHAGPLIPVWTVGTLLLWEVTERSELPSGPGRRALAGLSAIGTQDPECTASPPPLMPHFPIPPPSPRPTPPFLPPPLPPPGCTSAMHSLPESQLKQAGAPYRPPLSWTPWSPFRATGQVPLPCLPPHTNRWSPAEFTARWLANGGTREGGTQGCGQLRAGSRPVSPRALG